MASTKALVEENNRLMDYAFKYAAQRNKLLAAALEVVDAYQSSNTEAQGRAINELQKAVQAVEDGMV